MTRLTLIVAATKSNGIGANGQLPWKLSREIKYFARVTTNAPQGASNAVVMGRRTWESIPPKFRPLPKRVNLLISRNEHYDLGVRGGTGTALLRSSLQSAIQCLVNFPETPIYRTFLIGGASVYAEALALPRTDTSAAYVDRILLTRILSPAFDECDVFMPDFAAEDDKWKRADHVELVEWAGFDVPTGVQEENGVEYEFQMWVR